MYQHKVQYYETDMMGITHHSNYIRWMEEARTAFLEQIGWPYDKLEEQGIISPVVSVACQYKQPSTFPDLITISVNVLICKGAKLSLAYRMTNQKGEEICLAQSEHGFVTREGQPVRLKKVYPELYQCLIDLREKNPKEGEN